MRRGQRRTLVIFYLSKAQQVSILTRLNEGVFIIHETACAPISCERAEMWPSVDTDSGVDRGFQLARVLRETANQGSLTNDHVKQPCNLHQLKPGENGAILLIGTRAVHRRSQ